MTKQEKTLTPIEQLEDMVLGYISAEGFRIYEATIKIQPASALLILRAVREREYFVAFLGGTTPKKAIRAALNARAEEGFTWKPDKYKT